MDRKFFDLYYKPPDTLFYLDLTPYVSFSKIQDNREIDQSPNLDYFFITGDLKARIGEFGSDVPM